MTDELKIGVIGAGGRGGLARHAHKPEEGASITACCDVREELFPNFKKRYGDEIFVTTDHHELLKQDIGEKSNLADETPEKVKELHDLLKAWRKDTGAPVPIELNPKYRSES